jgi:DNA-binding NarL/FixJ family response regulator
MKILVVENHGPIRAQLQQMLAQVGTDVHVLQARTAAEAFAVARSEPDLDLVLLDDALPGVNGHSALAAFRKEHAKLQVIVLSESIAFTDIMSAMHGGAAGFIPKSSSPGVVLGAVRLVLSGGVYVPPELLRAQPMLQNEHDAAQWPLAGSPARTQWLDPAECGLSERQAQVLALVVQGKTNKAIGRELRLAEATVKAHISAALRALNVANRTQAVITVAQRGIDLARFAGSARQEKRCKP